MTDDRTTSSEPGGQMTLMEHLAELRQRLIVSLLAIAAGMVILTVFYNQVFDLFREPYCQALDRPDCNFQMIEPTEGMGIRIKLTMYGGIAFAMPIILWQLWRFVSPGLYDKEKHYATPFVASAMALFILGAGLAYWTMPRALEFLIDIGGPGIDPNLRPGAYIQLVTYMMLAFGVGFEFPIVLLFLQLAGILETDTLVRFRRYAIVLIAILVAVITPSGDPISMLALTLPMVVFYEIAILLGRWFAKRRSARDAS